VATPAASGARAQLLLSLPPPAGGGGAPAAATDAAFPAALNPISPCGSCMEWLRKVTEVNPDFRCVTFTDISCERVFIKPVPL
jgi:hypothetical protein